MKKIILLPFFLFSLQISFSQITFEKTYGGIYFDRGYSVQQTNDGGYIIAGIFSDSISSGSIIPNVCLIKTNSSGDTLWTKIHGGNPCGEGYSVQQTNDGGYIITGITIYNCLSDSSFTDVYLIKTNSLGDTLWTKTYGGTGNDYGWYVQQTNDNGYIIAGNSLNGIILIKTDINGDTLWTKTYGGNEGYSVQQTNDNGFIITGYTWNLGADIYLIKTDSTGDTLWTKTYGGTDWEFGNSVWQTNDNGYIITGSTKSFGAGSTDVYLIKTDANGDTLWTKTYGGSSHDSGSSIQQTNDNGYIIAGYTSSFGAGSTDVYLIKTDANGDTLWTKTYGGDTLEGAYSVQQTNDNGYIITGYTISLGEGEGDVYLIKTNENGNIIAGVDSIMRSYLVKSVQIYPNPNNGIFNLKTGKDIRSIEIFNIYGQIIYTKQVKNKTKSILEQINLSKHVKGIYFLKVKSEGFIKTEKIIIY